MGTMVSQVYEALIEAGASKAKAKAAAEAIPVKEQMATKQDIIFLKAEIAAEKGDAEAQYNLGVMYDLGVGVPEDDREAAKWYRKAADQGYAAAQSALGLKSHSGRGVEKDDREAVKWLRKAADQGDSSGQLHLGRMYYRGEGVPKDFVKAYAWLNLAAAQGEKFAATLAAVTRDKLVAKTSTEQVAAAQKLSSDLFNHIESAKPE